MQKLWKCRANIFTVERYFKIGLTYAPNDSTFAKKAAVNNSMHDMAVATIFSHELTVRAANRSRKRQASADGHLSDSDSQESYDVKIDAPIAQKVI